MSFQLSNSGLSGWLCPACGKGNSPFTMQCTCPGNYRVVIADGTTTTIQTINKKGVSAQGVGGV